MKDARTHEFSLSRVNSGGSTLMLVVALNCFCSEVNTFSGAAAPGTLAENQNQGPRDRANANLTVANQRL